MKAAQRSWSVDGYYSTWILTVTVAPSELSASEEPPELPSAELQLVADHFIQTVNYVEASRDLERLGRAAY